MSDQQHPGMMFVMDFPIAKNSGLEKCPEKVKAIIEEAGQELERGQAALLKKYGHDNYTVAKMVCNSARIQGILLRHGIGGTLLGVIHQHHVEMIQTMAATMRIDFDVAEKLAGGIDEHMELMQQQVKERIEELIKQEKKHV